MLLAIFTLLHWIAATVILPGWIAVNPTDPKHPIPPTATQHIVDGLAVWSFGLGSKGTPVVVCNFGNAMSLDQNATEIEQLLRGAGCKDATLVMWDYSD